MNLMGDETEGGKLAPTEKIGAVIVGVVVLIVVLVGLVIWWLR